MNRQLPTDTPGEMLIESGHVRISLIKVENITPAPENLQLCRPVRDDDPEIIKLAESIRKHGVLDPLVVTADGFILSGHRRHAARLAGLDAVPCRMAYFRRVDDLDRFVRLLREENRQREKSIDERLRMELITTHSERTK